MLITGHIGSTTTIHIFTFTPEVSLESSVRPYCMQGNHWESRRAERRLLCFRCQPVCSLLCEPPSAGHELRARGVLSPHQRPGAAAVRTQSLLRRPHQWLLLHRLHGRPAHRPMAAVLSHRQTHRRWALVSSGCVWIHHLPWNQQLSSFSQTLIVPFQLGCTDWWRWSRVRASRHRNGGWPLSKGEIARSGRTT